MSFRDGISIQYLLDDMDMENIIKILEEHGVQVSDFIAKSRRNLYYFLGNCTSFLQDSLRASAKVVTQSITLEVLKGLPGKFLAFLVKTRVNEHDVGAHGSGTGMQKHVQQLMEPQHQGL
ncbi:hypothetical protein IW262DRAFT_1497376 [Armillaria fumosa]|nr:hypothetical protein IW262DRAFT_1497376 [Armillaria fumosa]